MPVSWLNRASRTANKIGLPCWLKDSRPWPTSERAKSAISGAGSLMPRRLRLSAAASVRPLATSQRALCEMPNNSRKKTPAGMAARPSFQRQALPSWISWPTA